MEDVYNKVGSLVPKEVQKKFSVSLSYAGIDEIPREWLGRVLFFCVTIALLISLFVWAVPPYFSFYSLSIETASLMAVAVFLVVFISLLFIHHLSLYYTIRYRAERIEKLLPDFLLLLSSNLRAGMTPYEAFVRASRKEFYPLDEEIRLIATKLSGEGSLEVAMSRLGRRFDSFAFKHFVDFFNKAIRSGGHLAKLLEKSADELRKVDDLRQEFVASTKAYTIFLLFIVLLVMPFLLSISYQFILMFESIQSQQAVESKMIPMFSGEITLTKDFVESFSFLALIVSSLFIGILLGSIKTGKILYGIKYFPLLAFFSCFSFLLAREIVSMLIGTFI